MIYLDNAATTAMSEVAINALIKISSVQYGNPSAIYGFGRKTKDILENARRIIAGCIGAEPEEIYFTSCGTESDNWVIQQVSNGYDKLITSKVEHHAILHPAERLGDKTVYLSVDSECMVSEETLKEALDGKKTIVSIMMQNNETGAIQNIKELAEKVHLDNPDSIFHTDAVQAVGHIRIDVKELGVDMLSASAHKFNGPKGVGFIFIDKNCKIKPFIIGGGQEKGMRSGTENVAGIYSMAKALEDNVSKLDEIHDKVDGLEQLLFEQLSTNGIEYRVNGNSANRAKGVINLAIEGLDGEGLMNMLDMHDICISIGSACNSKSQDRSHVLLAMGLDETVIDSSVRISIGRFNTEDDISELVKWIASFKRIALLADS
ncbi:MAG: cysteine desulfurase [Eubacterium sp.]|nr:cysteine desulfurase [Eubacterium sp.]